MAETENRKFISKLFTVFTLITSFGKCFVLLVNNKGGCIGSSLNVICLTVKCQIFAMFGVYINLV